MKYVISAAVETIEILKTQPKLFCLYVFFGLLPLLASMERIPVVIDLFFLFISLGWFSVRFYYIHQAYQGKELDFNNLLKQLSYYALKLLPAVLIMFAALVIPILVLGLFYGRWFAQLYLDAGVGMTSRQAFLSLLPALFNQTLWKEFFSQNFFSILLMQSGQFFTLVGLLVAKLVAIFLVLKRYRVLEAISRSFFYINEQLSLLISFVLLRVFGNVFVKLFEWLLVNTIGLLSITVASLLLLVVASFVTYILDVFILSYFMKAEKKHFVRDNLMRWWSSKGKSHV